MVQDIPSHGKTTSFKKTKTDKSQLKSDNTNIKESINIYTEGDEDKKEANKSLPQMIYFLMEIEIIENMNPWKEPDSIDLTILEDENKHNF